MMDDIDAITPCPLGSATSTETMSPMSDLRATSRHEQAESVSQGIGGGYERRPREALDADVSPPAEVRLLQFRENECRAQLREHEHIAAKKWTVKTDHGDSSLESMPGFAKREHDGVARISHQLAAAELTALYYTLRY
ncbi:hypothetical protein EKO27_g7474 [Xylaria grammica]|uniref:Uncharacterized protein n=1 Tax=Xylaria grammica TaxID=363999 RepID=A0A439CZN2_9PEZI|nr:hypothetical protein EKO27_g7474 [Xylaria grammica]